MPSVVQVYPSRITVTPLQEKSQFHDMEFTKQNPSYIALKKERYISNFKVKNNPFVLSKASKKKLMDSINSMYILSNPRKIEMRTGKFIYNYKMSFITLTLPSSQAHTDIEIKHICLNQFLIEIKKAYKVENYIWKAELQQNENIHFHLLLDKYIDFQALRRRWNRCINKLGYVDKYKDKMDKLTLSQYHDLRKKNPQNDFAKSAKAYAKGKSENWSNPNSVDVRSVYSKNELAIYLSKYITKKVSKDENTNENAERQHAFGRSWARSYSLSNLKYKNKFLLSEVKNLINYLEENKELVLKITGDFFQAYYFSAEKLSKKFIEFHRRFIFGNANMYNYPLPHI